MTPKKLNFILLGSLLIMLIAFIGGAYFINKTLKKEADVLTVKKAKYLAQEQEKLSLKKAKADIKKYSYLNDIAKTIVPEDKDQAQTVREIINLANANGIDIASITFPASTLGKVGTGTGTSAPAASSQSTAVLVNPKSTSKPTKTDQLSQLLPVKGVPGVYQLSITVQSNTSNPPRYSELISFLKALETNRRTALISSLTLSPKKESPNNVSFELTLNEYIKP